MEKISEEWEDALTRDVSKAVADMYSCPHCGYRFSIFQSRGIACVGCRNSVMNCPNLRCPKCDCEFKIGDGKKDIKDDLMMRGISSFIERDMRHFGERYG